MKKYDLAVIGGGLAGVAAAISAARAGANVIIIEKSNCFGGAATNALVNPFMPYSTKINGEWIQLCRGIFKEICENLYGTHAMLGDILYGDSFLEEELKYILNNMLKNAGVDILFHANLFEAERLGDSVRSVKVAVRAEVVKIEADYFIDATGDAQLAYILGCPTRLGRETDNLCQPMTLCFRLGNVNTQSFYESLDELQKAYKASLEAGELSNPRENILVFKTPVPNVLHFNTTRVVRKNPTSPTELTEAELIARAQVHETYDFMKKHAKGLEDSFLMMTASEIGIRESRMIIGDYRLTEADCKNLTKFDDAIAACNYDMDIHNPEGSGTSHYYFPEGAYYTIPYRSLLPKNAENLLVAGRCISSDHGAQASYRIMPTVATIGEAAGVAAALATRTDAAVRAVDVSELQGILRRRGAFLGI